MASRRARVPGEAPASPAAPPAAPRALRAHLEHTSGTLRAHFGHLGYLESNSCVVWDLFTGLPSFVTRLFFFAISSPAPCTRY